MGVCTRCVLNKKCVPGVYIDQHNLRLLACACLCWLFFFKNTHEQSQAQWCQDAQQWNQDVPRWSQDAPRWTQNAPRWSQDALRWSQYTTRWRQDVQACKLWAHAPISPCLEAYKPLLISHCSCACKLLLISHCSCMGTVAGLSKAGRYYFLAKLTIWVTKIT